MSAFLLNLKKSIASPPHYAIMLLQKLGGCMTEKVKLKDLLVVIEKGRDVKFGNLNKENTRFKFLTDKEICNVKGGLQTYDFEDRGYFYDIKAYKVEISTGKTSLACPLIYRSKETDTFTRHDVFTEYDQIDVIFDHFIRRCGGDKSGRVKKIKNILYKALGIDEKEDEFCNDNRNKIVDVEYITKLEQAIANTASGVRKKDLDQDKEAYDRTRSF